MTMNEVCQSCGSPKDVLSCAHCALPMCGNCQSNHEYICKENQKRIRRGEGPTIRRPVVTLPVSKPVALTPDLSDLRTYRDELQALEDTCQSLEKFSPTHSHDDSCFVEPVVYVEDAQRESEVQFASEAYDDRDDSPYNPEGEYEEFEQEHGGEA